MNLRGVLRGTAVVLGGLAIALGGVVGLVLSPRPAPGGPRALGVVVVLLGIAVGMAKCLHALLRSTDSPPPWTEAGSLVETAPEATPDDDRVSGTSLLPVVEKAGKRARSARSVEAGLSVVRPPLRETLEAALVRAGRDAEAVDEALADGTWTDDPVAAAVLDDGVSPPERSLPRRVWAWLFPERAVRDRTARAVGAVAAASDEALPPIVGQDAARPIPVVAPTVDDLRRTADGRLQRAESIGSRGERDRHGPNAVDGRDDATRAVTVDSDNVGERSETGEGRTGTDDGRTGTDDGRVDVDEGRAVTPETDGLWDRVDGEGTD